MAPVHEALAEVGVSQTLVHTGQHYDDRLSESFFLDLELPRPDVNLGVGSGSHAVQTAAVMTGLEDFLSKNRPHLLLVYGDVNSTLAGALVAAKLGVPVAHVEAGLRSGDMSMPEEINRRLTDQISDLLFATSADAVENLQVEGLSSRSIHLVGNTMIDTLLKVKPKLDNESILARLKIDKPYAVATLHRPSNVDSEESANQVVAMLRTAARHLPVVLPLHPRGRSNLERAGVSGIEGVLVTEPLGYLDFISLVMGASAVMTDSGGIQEETTVLGVPCLTLRDTTERPVTISHGSNRLVNAANFEQSLVEVLSTKQKSHLVPELWDGRSGGRIAGVVSDWLARD
jgi:UDP-N-acetylglucosamine 2-epimerase (non-hydrolysing)